MPPEAEEPITLKEVQLRLGAPQHVLIHLCEKGVIEPDFAETAGRGKRREFSQRNLFEFGVALALRRLELPVTSTAFVVRLLRTFALATARAVEGFALPGALLDDGLDLRLHHYDASLVVLQGRGGRLLRRPILLAANAEPGKGAAARPRVEKLDALPSEFDVHLEVDLGHIARRVLA